MIGGVHPCVVFQIPKDRKNETCLPSFSFPGFPPAAGAGRWWLQGIQQGKAKISKQQVPTKVASIYISKK